jgi:hypothetical protein
MESITPIEAWTAHLGGMDRSMPCTFPYFLAWPDEGSLPAALVVASSPSCAACLN